MKPSTGIRRALGIAGLTAAALIAFAAAQAGLRDEPETSVFTEPVVRGTVEETVLANGVLEPIRMISVGAQVSGQLKSLHVELGQTIRAGDLIAEIDPTPQVNALRVAEAALASIRAQRKARGIQLRQAERVRDRQKTMALQKAVSAADLETAEAALGTLEAEVEALEAQINQASVEVENAKSNLGYTRVVAPMDGVVVAVVTKAGQTLNANQAVPTIVVLAQLDVMRVRVQISEADIGRVKSGQPVRFTIMGNAQAATAGTLDRIEPAPVSIATEATGATTAGHATAPAVYYNGVFTTPNPEGRLRPMMTAVVTIVAGRAEEVPLVAWSALTERDGSGRYRVQVRSAAGEITERLVAIGLTDRISAQVIDGLEIGEEVIIPADGQASDSSTMEMM
ncbi:efflux RND transporter periplasmic adaptor subunit [Aquibium microcysteis]|uniref:efflux RND transporter periplasmic adaptor subunit n=1 Tax=Aquibium microcysteis TaxID=675281 RepID=UPI00165CF2FE|nr:efflux RND transporter periplasmic adaptor subunit [Aquibium microcysteis]